MSANPFEQWYANGYADLLPIVPHDARCKPSSHVGAGKGKSPGLRDTSGLWGGFSGWNTHIATPADLAKWNAMGAGIGLRIGTAWMLDLDVYDADTADMIEAAALEMLGPAPCRIGQAPKRSLLYASAGDIRAQTMHFAGKQGEVNNIEIPSQSVVQGIHAKTHRPYTWPRPPVARDKLTMVTPVQLAAFQAAMKARLPGASSVSGAGDNDINQKTLIGHPDVIAEIMTRLPNTADMRWDYMIKMGYAVKAALPDDDALAFELWESWCSRWEADGYDPEYAAVRWNSLKGPYRVGAPWLYDEGHRLLGEHEHFDFRAQLGDGLTLEAIRDQADNDNDPIDDTGPLFSENLPKSEKAEAADYYPVVDIDTLLTRDPPKMLIARHFPEQSVGFLYGEPGSYKSFLILDVSLSIAASLDAWQGDAVLTDPDSVVVYLAAEGSFGFRNRISAWCKARGIDPAALSRRFKMIEVTVNFMEPKDVQKLMRTVRSVVGARPCLLVVDTVSRSLPGADENMQKDMTMFVHACDALKVAFQCAVVGVHHANKTGGDMRGSTVLRGAGDFVFRMTRKPESELVTLHCEKQKDAPSDWKEMYAVSTVALAHDESSLVLDRLERPALDTDMSPELARRVLLAMQAAWDAGEPWAKAAQAKERWAVRRMNADFDLRSQAAEDALRGWVQTGVVEVATVDTRYKKAGYRVCMLPGQDVSESGIFD